MTEISFRDDKSLANSRLGWISHELFYWHDAGPCAGMLPLGPDIQPYTHIESPESKRRIESLLAVNGLLDKFQRLTPRPATAEELMLVHSEAHLVHIEHLASSNGGEAGVYAPVSYHSAQAAQLAAGAAITAVEAALKHSPNSSYCLVRPPGHHAEPDRAMAFCLYNNMGIAARVAQRMGCEKIVILDWDVHHGNGIQKIFYTDPQILYISIHQEGLFPPMSGLIHELGSGPGKGYNINIPLPAGSGHGAFVATMEQIVRPVIEQYDPDLILIAAGQDSAGFDPMGNLLAHSETFRYMTRAMVALAEKHCSGRLVAIHEGGYNPCHVPFLVRAIVTEMAGLPPLHDPFLTHLQELPGQQLLPHQAQRIEEVQTSSRLFF